MGAFPTIGFAPLVLVAWIPLLRLAPDMSWRRRLVWGWVMGALYQAGLFRWIVFTMREMSGLPTAVGLGGLGAFSLWHGLMAGVFLCLAEPARRSAVRIHPGLGPLAVAAVYAATEWVWPILFPWGLGQAFWQVGPLASLMAWTGVPGLSFLVISVSSALAELWRENRARQLIPTAIAVITLLGLGFGWWLHVHTTEPRRTLSVAALQMNYTLDEKRHANLAMRGRLFRRFEDRVRSIPAGRYDLVVASEGAFPLYWDVDVETAAADAPELATRGTRRIQAAIRAGPRTDAIFGGMRRSGDKRMRNSAVHLGGSGGLRDHYDKVVLVPFGEYLPGTSLFPDLAGSIQGVGNFAAGTKPCRFQAAGEVVACGICYESLLPGLTREAAADDAALLVNLTIDTWFGASTAPWFHLMSQASRAAELGIPLVRSALTGISALVGADGVPYAVLPLDQDGILAGEVPLKDLTTPYRLVGPLFAWLCLLATVALLLAAWRRR